MNKETKKTLIPKLRFPEFRNAESWVEDTIGNVCRTYSGGTPLTSRKEFYGGNIPFIRSAEIDKEYTELFLTTEGLKNSASKLINKGAVLLALYGANSGEVALSKQEGAINQAVLCLISENSNEFIYQFLSYKKNWIVNKFIQGGQGNLSGEIVKSINIPFPKRKEQQKIVDCLSSLDEFIGAQTQKIDALKAHKKSLMQQLFPAEGEGLPKLRFAEFVDSGDWKEKPLGKVAGIITGNTPSTVEPSYYGGDRLFVSPADISEVRYITHTKTTLSEKGFSHTRHVKENSILFVCIGSTIGKVAQNKVKCATNQQINALVPYEGYSSNFIYSALEYNSARIASLAGIHAVPIINKTSFSSVLLSFPNPAEQQKIADCLSSIDELIDSQTQKHKALIAHKKGLMQKLFPSTNQLINE